MPQSEDSCLAWRYPTDARNATPPAADFLEHVCSRNFHQRILCPRTGAQVTFAVCGDVHSSSVLLYCLPSGCSRYLGLMMDGICRMVGIKLITIDRPGSGGTSPCALEDRLSASLLQTISVMQEVGILDPQMRPRGPPVTILAHSAGIFYALALLQHFNPAPVLRLTGVNPKHSPFGKRPRLLLSSPWVPTSISKSSLSLLPVSFIRLNTSLMPGLQKLFGAATASMGVVSHTGRNWLGWSAGVVHTNSHTERGHHRTSSFGPKPDDASSSHRRAGSNSTKLMVTPRAAREREMALSCPTTPVSALPELNDSQGPLLSSQAQALSSPTAPNTPSNDNPFLNSIGSEPPTSPTTRRGQKIRAEARQKHPEATFFPPYECHFKYSMHPRAFPRAPSQYIPHPGSMPGKRYVRLDPGSAVSLISDLMALEHCAAGMTEDFLLSLGHAPHLPNSELERLIREGINSLAQSPHGADVTCVWAQGDKLVPQKGRDWLDALFMQARAASANASKSDSKSKGDANASAPAGLHLQPSAKMDCTSGFESEVEAASRFVFERMEMADAGHDATMGSEAVVVEFLRRAKHDDYDFGYGRSHAKRHLSRELDLERHHSSEEQGSSRRDTLAFPTRSESTRNLGSPAAAADQRRSTAKQDGAGRHSWIPKGDSFLSMSGSGGSIRSPRAGASVTPTQRQRRRRRSSAPELSPTKATDLQVQQLQRQLDGTSGLQAGVARDKELPSLPSSESAFDVAKHSSSSVMPPTSPHHESEYLHGKPPCHVFANSRARPEFDVPPLRTQTSHGYEGHKQLDAPGGVCDADRLIAGQSGNTSPWSPPAAFSQHPYRAATPRSR